MLGFRLAAAQEAAGAQARAAPADTMGGAHQPATPGPSSLFIFANENPIRRLVLLTIISHYKCLNTYYISLLRQFIVIFCVKKRSSFIALVFLAVIILENILVEAIAKSIFLKYLFIWLSFEMSQLFTSNKPRYTKKLLAVIIIIRPMMMIAVIIYIVNTSTLNS